MAGQQSIPTEHRVLSEGFLVDNQRYVGEPLDIHAACQIQARC